MVRYYLDVKGKTNPFWFSAVRLKKDHSSIVESNGYVKVLGCYLEFKENTLSTGTSVKVYYKQGSFYCVVVEE